MENFSLLLPFKIKEANIVSTNVLDNEYPNWVAGTYSLGQRVHVVLADLHYIYESTINGNTAAPDISVQSANNWVRVAETNKFKLFDPSISTKTEYPEFIEYTLQNIGRYNTLYFGNIEASSIEVTIKDSLDAVIYSNTVNLVPNISQSSWFSYRYGTRARQRELYLDGLPINSNTKLTFKIINSGLVAKVGVIIVGVNSYFGNSAYGANFGIKDFSYVASDDFGNTIAVERVYGRSVELTIHIEKTRETYFANKLTDFRAKFVLYRGAKNRTWLTSYGLCKWRAVIPYETETIFNLTIEGST